MAPTPYIAPVPVPIPNFNVYVGAGAVARGRVSVSGCIRARETPLARPGCDDGASVGLAVVQELIGLGGALQREVFDEHSDLPGLREVAHVRRARGSIPRTVTPDYTRVARTMEVDRQGAAPEADDGEVPKHARSPERSCFSGKARRRRA